MDSADTIDSHNPRVKGRADAQRTVDILREDPGHQAIPAIISSLENFLLGLELVDHRDGSEYFVLVDGSIGFRVEEDCRLDVVALGAYWSSAYEESALFLGLCAADYLQNAVILGLVNDWPYFCAFGLWIAHRLLLGRECFLVRSDELVVDAFLDVYSR